MYVEYKLSIVECKLSIYTVTYYCNWKSGKYIDVTYHDRQTTGTTREGRINNRIGLYPNSDDLKSPYRRGLNIELQHIGWAQSSFLFLRVLTSRPSPRRHRQLDWNRVPLHGQVRGGDGKSRIVLGYFSTTPFQIASLNNLDLSIELGK